MLQITSNLSQNSLTDLSVKPIFNSKFRICSNEQFHIDNSKKYKQMMIKKKINRNFDNKIPINYDYLTKIYCNL